MRYVKISAYVLISDPLSRGAISLIYKLYNAGHKYDIGFHISTINTSRVWRCAKACTEDGTCNSFHFHDSGTCELSYVVLQCLDALTSTPSNGTHFYAAT